MVNSIKETGKVYALGYFVLIPVPIAIHLRGKSGSLRAGPVVRLMFFFGSGEQEDQGGGNQG